MKFHWMKCSDVIGWLLLCCYHFWRRRSAESNVDPEEESRRKKIGVWPHNLSALFALLATTIGLFNISRFALLSIEHGGNLQYHKLINDTHTINHFIKYCKNPICSHKILRCRRNISNHKLFNQVSKCQERWYQIEKLNQYVRFLTVVEEIPFLISNF